MKECSRQDFEKFNATFLFDDFDVLDPLNFNDENNETNFKRYCFDIAKNETFPLSGNSSYNRNGTFYN